MEFSEDIGLGTICCRIGNGYVGISSVEKTCGGLDNASQTATNPIVMRKKQS